MPHPSPISGAIKYVRRVNARGSSLSKQSHIELRPRQQALAARIAMTQTWAERAAQGHQKSQAASTAQSFKVSSTQEAETGRTLTSASIQPQPIHSDVRKAHQTPLSAPPDERFWVVTLGLTPSIDQPMNELRTKYFPPGSTSQVAHISLFHAIPDSIKTSAISALEDVSRSHRPFDVSTGTVFRMKRGVGIRMRFGSRAVTEIHEAIQDRLGESLSEQDLQNLWPHWTVMNFENDEGRVSSVLEELKDRGVEETGRATGLLLWEYDRNGWIFEKEFSFGRS